MPKLKTNKTLIKRIKITKSGKLLKKANNMRHLNRKNTSSKRFRKAGDQAVTTHGYIKVVKLLLGKLGRKLS